MGKGILSFELRIWKDIAIYGSELWSTNAVCRRRIEAYEMICYREMLKIPWHKGKLTVRY